MNPLQCFSFFAFLTKKKNSETTSLTVRDIILASVPMRTYADAAYIGLKIVNLWIDMEFCSKLYYVFSSCGGFLKAIFLNLLEFLSFVLFLF